MLTRCLPAAVLAAAVLVPSAASADPISVSVHSTENGGSAAVVPIPGVYRTYMLGGLTLPTADSAVTLAFSGLGTNANYLMEMLIYGSHSTWNTLRAEVLDPLDDDDHLDVAPYHAGVPAGYSTSNTRDGFSFAQSSGLQRSAVWMGGSAAVNADENTDAGDVLLFTGVAGATDSFRLTFGLRDYDGNRNFLVRLSAADGMATTPEPASMLLIGTGLAGLAAMRRRRKAKSVQ